MSSKNHDHVHCATENKHEDGCMQNFKHKEDFGNTWRSKCLKLFEGTRRSCMLLRMCSWSMFFIDQMLGHINLKSLLNTKSTNMCLGKKYVDTLPKQWSYDCTIDFKKGVQPPFGPIYNLSQDELVVFQ